MKKLIIICLILPVCLRAQTVVLNHNQSAALSFEENHSDTTILKGQSVTLGTDLVISGGSGDYNYAWSPGISLSDSTALFTVATPKDTTQYFLTVYDTSGCAFFGGYKVNVKKIPTGVLLSDQIKNLEVKVFPNPSSGKFKVLLTGKPQKNIQLTIIDFMGRMIQRQEVIKFEGEYLWEFNMNLSAGVYSLFVNSDFNEIRDQFVIR